MAPRTLRPGQRAEVWIAEVAGGSSQLVYSTDTLLLEAPNWAPDGGGLLLNGDGLLWRLELEPEAALQLVPIEDLPPINNDHVLDAKHGLIYLSANDGHIYVAPVEGGTAKRITHDPSRFHFLHDVGPNAMLAFVDIPRSDLSVPGRLALISTAGGETHYPETGSSHLDGPEYSPDGAWLYFNTEEFGSRPGHAQLARLPADGGRMEHLVESETVDWFPHLSPDAELARSVFRRARLDIRPTWTWRCGWFAPRIGAMSCGASRSSAGREPSTSTAGRPTAVSSRSWRIRCNGRDRMTQPGT
jgi:TolB protein